MSVPLRLGGVPEHFNLPFHLLQEGESSISFSWQEFPGGTGALCKALEANELDMATLLTEGAVAYNARGGKLVLPAFWVQTPLRWGIHTGATSGIHYVQDLKGKQFAISRPGSGSQLMAYLLAKREGWKPTDLSFVEVGHLAGAEQALVHNEAAGFLWERFMTQPLVTAGKFKRLGEIPTPWPAFVFAVRPDVWANRQADVIQLIKSLLEKAQEIKENKESYLEIATRYGLTEEDAKEWLSITEWAYPFNLNIKEELGKTEQILREVGVL